ncbi:TolC family protein [Pontibacter sp. 172403-2]|uniref:TolC family protein n=1 Tax=Pontibacter rufus TaxID=2791028 RepID=UPI0018AF742E|nr:TolC family protein [Pontibacter sp. 172403-2]MBF9252762.1 TolC family protein [Pontibacter sp. 172403-2]
MKNVTPKALLRKLGGLAVCLGVAASVQAQELLTLEQSLELARLNNVALRQAKYNSSKATVKLRQNQFAYLPAITARGDISRVNGLTFDNVQGEVKRGNTTTSNPYLVGELVLFEGFARLFEMKQAREQATAGKYTASQAEIDLEATITGKFMQAILDRENIRIATERIALLEQQTKRMEILERAGTHTESDVYQLKSQLATEKLNLITNQNNYRQSMLALVQEMNAGSNLDYELQAPTDPLDITAPLPPLDSVLARAVAYSPLLKASKATVGATQYGLSMARSNLSPTLSLNGIVGSNFSSNIMQTNPETQLQEQTPYFDQLNQNQQNIVQLSLSIPVFNGLRNHFQAQMARIDLRNAELDYVATENTLRQTVQQAYQDVLAAREKYNTVIANLAYTEKAYEMAQRRYEAGVMDFYAYLESLNNKNKAEAELIQSKCEFYFKQRILQLYQG